MLVRDGLSLCFFMKRLHSEIAPGVMRSLEYYLQALGPSALDSYADPNGEWQPLDEGGWRHIRQDLLKPIYANIHLVDAAGGEERYRFDYRGRELGDPSLRSDPTEACFVSYWLPTELLEERGPQWVRELILGVAAPLPFDSGNAGLAFNCDLGLLGVAREVHRYCFRHPGMDVLHPSLTTLNIGTQVRGPSWLTFLGQPVLGELGGAAGLRSRLKTPGTTVQEMEGDRAVVTLCPWPEAGDTEQGKDLPAYRELARVLEPWTLFGDARSFLRLDPDEARRWERRFLD
jgi:hypothetical protein